MRARVLVQEVVDVAGRDERQAGAVRHAREQRVDPRPASSPAFWIST